MEERDLPPQCLFSRNLIVESVSRWSGYMNVCWLSLMKKDKKGNAVPGIRKTFRFSRTGQWPVTERNNKMYPTWNYMQFWIEKLIKWTSKRPKLISGPLMMKKEKKKRREREREPLPGNKDLFASGTSMVAAVFLFRHAASKQTTVRSLLIHWVMFCSNVFLDSIESCTCLQ